MVSIALLRTCLTAALSATVLPVASTAFAAAPATQPDVASLIESLGDRDPMTRSQAVNELKKLGQTAREQLLAATHDPDPEIRTRAAGLLGSLPLIRPGDNAVVRRLLEQFRTTEPTARQAFIEDLLSRERDAGVSTVLIRILTDAVSEDDRWNASRALRFQGDPVLQKQIRQLKVTDENIPLLVTVGWSLQSWDTRKGNSLLRKAADLAAERSAPLSDEMLAVVMKLTENALAEHQFTDALTLLRRQMDLIPANPGAVPTPWMQIVALHAEYGPFDGFADDLRRGRDWERNSPVVTYCVARLWQRLGASRLTTDAIAEFALHQPSRTGNGLDHGSVGLFLYDLKWNDWAKAEYLAAPIDENYTTSDRDVRLAMIASGANDHARAAELLDSALANLPNSGFLFKPDRQGKARTVGASQLRIDTLFEQLLAARDAGNKQVVTDRLNDLLLQPLSDIDMIAELLPLLHERKREGEVANIFNRLYDFYKQQLNMNPDSPELLNNLAWLCARTAEKPDEAVELAKKANDTDKDNAAYLDTQAEAHFHLGQYDDAIRLETRALELRPQDEFMTGQLERFKAAKAGTITPSTAPSPPSPSGRG